MELGEPKNSRWWGTLNNGSSNSDPDLLELYKLAVEMADRVSARRATANAFFVTIQSAIVAAAGWLASRDPSPDKIYLIMIFVVGLLTSATWFMLLRSYRDLNTAKFTVINDLEKWLPIGIYGNEWNTLKQDTVHHWRDRYAELGTIERVVPGIYALVFLVLAVAVLCG